MLPNWMNRGRGVTRNSRKREEAVYTANEKPNKSCADAINMPVILLVLSESNTGLLRDEEKSIGYTFHNISWEQLV